MHFRDKWVIAYGYDIHGTGKQNYSLSQTGHRGDEGKDSNVQEILVTITPNIFGNRPK